jgi:hypothetical protein
MTMSDVAPMAHRPEKLDDLRFQFKLTPKNIVSAPDLNEDRDIARWRGNVLASAMEVPAFVVDKSGAIIRPLTDEEKQEILTSDQESYDRGRSLYQAYLDDGSIPKWSYVWSCYLDYENLDAPEKEAEDE